MKHIMKIVCVLLICSFWTHTTSGQETIAATGQTASGSGGTATYTAGQLFFNVIKGTTGSLIQGVQQPYEVSVITSVENTEDITLECTVYPNPTSRIIRLVFKSLEDDNMMFRLYDMNGILLQDKKIEDKETDVPMDNLSPSVYFLKIIKNKAEVRVFKIIKK
jgi:hypothetical protein